MMATFAVLVLARAAMLLAFLALLALLALA